jgi:hypothetical protein
MNGRSPLVLWVIPLPLSYSIVDEIVVNWFILAQASEPSKRFRKASKKVIRFQEPITRFTM